jgi:hypothetical protein
LSLELQIEHILKAVGNTHFFSPHGWCC